MIKMLPCIGGCLFVVQIIEKALEHITKEKLPALNFQHFTSSHGLI